MSGIFNESNMLQALKKYIPNGEALLAGIHAVAKETETVHVFKNCICAENRLVPSEGKEALVLRKKKRSAYDIYFGITPSFFVIVDCGPCDYLYQVSNAKDITTDTVCNLTSDLNFEDIGKCFSLVDIKSCQIKKGLMGSVQCLLTMKNGSYFKLMLPKLGGLGGGMPHHTEYRDLIIARLSENKK